MEFTVFKKCVGGRGLEGEWHTDWCSWINEAFWFPPNWSSFPYPHPCPSPGPRPPGLGSIGRAKRLWILESGRYGIGGFPGDSVKNMLAKAGDAGDVWVRSLGWEDPLEKMMATLSSILAGEILGQRGLVGDSPWAPRVGRNWAYTHRYGNRLQLSHCLYEPA